jgi:anti-sigma factor ChrR (cupin superfamily)
MTSVDAVLNQLIDLNDIDWRELVPGVAGKRVWADPATKRTAMFLRFSAGATLPRHAHEGDELVYVLDGSVVDEYAAVTAGNVGYRPNGCTHTVRSPTGATAFAVVTGGAVPRDDDVAGGPRSEVYDLATTAWRGAGPGLRWKRYWADPAAGRMATVMRWEPGAEVPAHRHIGDELAFVIEGALEDESGMMRPGIIGYRPNGCAHQVRSPYGATVLSYLWGDVEPI